MVSKTATRVASGLVIIAVLTGCIYFGSLSLNALILLMGVIAIDEIYCNLLRLKRLNVLYLSSMVLFLAPFLSLICFKNYQLSFSAIAAVALVWNVLLLFYLFFTKIESLFVVNLVKRFPLIIPLIVLIPFSTIELMLELDKWRQLIVIMLVLSAGMDIGAWFFGTLFGRHKLWPAISPKKTVEGLIGGMFTAGLLGSLFWYLFWQKFTIVLFILFSFLGFVSQLGDLVQSKIKRQCKIKDSSTLIPGHGGVYDRIDSLLFLAPFYLIILKGYFDFS